MFQIVDDNGETDAAVAGGGANEAPAPCNIENPLSDMIDFARCPVWIEALHTTLECVSMAGRQSRP